MHPNMAVHCKRECETCLFWTEVFTTWIRKLSKIFWSHKVPPVLVQMLIQKQNWPQTSHTHLASCVVSRIASVWIQGGFWCWEPMTITFVTDKANPIPLQWLTGKFLSLQRSWNICQPHIFQLRRSRFCPRPCQKSDRGCRWDGCKSVSLLLESFPPSNDRWCSVLSCDTGSLSQRVV